MLLAEESGLLAALGVGGSPSSEEGAWSWAECSVFFLEFEVSIVDNPSLPRAIKTLRMFGSTEDEDHRRRELLNVVWRSSQSWNMLRVYILLGSRCGSSFVEEAELGSSVEMKGFRDDGLREC